MMVPLSSFECEEAHVGCPSLESDLPFPLAASKGHDQGSEVAAVDGRTYWQSPYPAGGLDPERKKVPDKSELAVPEGLGKGPPWL